MTTKGFVAVSVVSLFALAACSSSSSSSPGTGGISGGGTGGGASGGTGGVASGGVGGGQASGTILDVAGADPRFTTLVAALVKASLADTLKGSGPFTVFAPTDDAFAALKKAGVDATALDVPTLTAVLKFHVVAAKDPASAVAATTTLTTLGGSVNVGVRGANVYLNGLTLITQTDIQASNGVVHVIDSVLLPDTSVLDLAGIATAYPTLSSLAGAVTSANLASALQAAGPFTLFAPVNSAFAALSNPPSSSQLPSILEYHVVSGAVASTAAIAAAQAAPPGNQHRGRADPAGLRALGTAAVSLALVARGGRGARRRHRGRAARRAGLPPRSTARPGSPRGRVAGHRIGGDAVVAPPPPAHLRAVIAFPDRVEELYGPRPAHSGVSRFARRPGCFASTGNKAFRYDPAAVGIDHEPRLRTQPIGICFDLVAVLLLEPASPQADRKRLPERPAVFSGTCPGDLEGGLGVDHRLAFHRQMRNGPSQCLGDALDLRHPSDLVSGCHGCATIAGSGRRLKSSEATGDVGQNARDVALGEASRAASSPSAGITGRHAAVNVERD